MPALLPGETDKLLSELLGRREQLINMLNDEKENLRTTPLLQKELVIDHIDWLKQRIRAIEKEIDDISR